MVLDHGLRQWLEPLFGIFFRLERQRLEWSEVWSETFRSHSGTLALSLSLPEQPFH